APAPVRAVAGVRGRRVGRGGARAVAPDGLLHGQARRGRDRARPGRRPQGHRCDRVRGGPRLHRHRHAARDRRPLPGEGRGARAVAGHRPAARPGRGGRGHRVRGNRRPGRARVRGECGRGVPVRTPALPAGFTVRLGRDTRAADGGRTLVGGSGTVLHLRARARAMLADGTLVTRDADSGSVARLLLDRDLADPVWPSAPCDDAAVDDVTVVVPVQDRPRQLARLLDALPPTLPVVVVDDGSADPGPTRAVAGEYGARLLRHETGRGPAAARNTGLSLVDTDHVAFVDSDVVP